MNFGLPAGKIAGRSSKTAGAEGSPESLSV